MIQRLMISAALAAALGATACAGENPEEPVDPAATENSAEAASEPSAEPAPAVQDAPAATPDFPDEAWREVSQDNLLYIGTEHGMIVVEMAPEFAPNHVERMRTLAADRFYDFLVWHRVIDGFMAQGGGARSNPNHRTDLPPVNAEFTVRRGYDMEISELQDRVVNPRSFPQLAKAGFWNGFPVGTQPIAQAGITADGMVESWILHCEGAAAMARTSDPNSAGSQFYITRAAADHLNATYTVWGHVRHGQDAVNAIAVGTLGQDMGFTPDVIESMRVGSELPAEEQISVEVIDTGSDAFAAYLESLRDADGALPDICDIDVPVRIEE